MADDGKKYEIEIAAETEAAEQNIEKVDAGLEGVGQSGEAAAAKLNSTGTAAGKLKSEAGGASGQVDHLKGSLDKSKTSADKAAASFNKAGASAKNMGTAAQGATGGLVEKAHTALKPMDDLNAVIGQVTASIMILGAAAKMGWEIGTWLRGANEEAGKLKANLQDVHDLMQRNRKIAAEARAEQVSKTVKETNSALARSSSVEDVASAQQTSLKQLSALQAQLDALQRQRVGAQRVMETASMSGDHAAYQQAASTWDAADSEIKVLTEQIATLSEVVEKASDQYSRAVRSGMRPNSNIDIDEFMRGNQGPSPDYQTTPTSFGGGSLLDYQHINQVRQQGTGQKEDTKTSQSLDSANETGGKTAQALQQAANGLDRNNREMLAAVMDIIDTQDRQSAQIAALNNRISAVAARAARSANAA